MALITSKKKTGDALGSNLVSALNRSTGTVQQRGQRTVLIKLASLMPHPNNSRKMHIPLEVMKKVLRVGESDSLLVPDTESGTLSFPDREEFQRLTTDVDFSSKDVCRFYDKIRGLTCSIYKQGLLQCIDVHQIESTDSGLSYIINIGHRRCYAYQLLNRTEIECFVKQSSAFSAFDSSLRRWDENDKHAQLSFLERVHNISLIKSEYVYQYGREPEQKELRLFLGLTRSDMSNYMKCINAHLTDEEQSIISDNSLQDLRTIGEICRITDIEQRLVAFGVYRDKGNTAARKWVNNYLKSLDVPITSPAVPESAKLPPVRVKASVLSVQRLNTLLSEVAPHLTQGLDVGTMTPERLLAEILIRLDNT